MIRRFAVHPTASHLLMAIMILAGLLSLSRLNTQFFPDFGIDIVTVSVAWSGAGAEDMENHVVKALESEVRFLDGVSKVTSSAREGWAAVYVEYKADADMQVALGAVESAVSQITTLPEGAERPVITQVVRYDTISRLVLYGAIPEVELKHLAKNIKNDLLAIGIDKVSIFPLRDEEIHVEVQPATLMALDMTLDDIAEQIRSDSQDLPSGDTRGDAEHQIRGIGLRQNLTELSGLEIRTKRGGKKLGLGDIAVLRNEMENGPSMLLNGFPAVELHIQRVVGQDALLLADRVKQYVNDLPSRLPDNLRILQFDVAANLIRERINLLLRNGIGGLVLVLGILFIFLNTRVALWIAVGIPTAVLGSLAAMLVTGQTINMVSLFAMIMMIGIVVDDAIVVGEHALVKRSSGLGPSEAAVAGAKYMMVPVVSASLTTVAAFLPVMMISGIIGEIIVAIPLVVVAVLLASLVECFLILPGHMRGAFSMGVQQASKFRRHFDKLYVDFRDTHFRRIVERSIKWRYTTLSCVLGSLILAIGLVLGGRVQFVFFPSPESDIIYTNFAFTPGTSRNKSKRMVSELSRALSEADSGFEGEADLVRVALGTIGAPVGSFAQWNTAWGDHIGGMMVELVPSEQRDVRTNEVIDVWRALIQEVPGIETLTIQARQGGPPGRDLDIRLSGGESRVLKQAALEVRDLIKKFEGVRDIADDLPWGKQELVFSVNPYGQLLGFTTAVVAGQVRDAFDGAISYRFIRGDEQVTVRVQFPRNAISSANLRGFYVRSQDGIEVPLIEVVDLETSRGFAMIRREDSVREVAITAEVEEVIINPTELVSELTSGGLMGIAERYGIDFRFAGKAEEQGETLSDMGIGAIVSLVSIYIILAWVFASYFRPLVVMSIIPFAVVGAIYGHWLLGYDLTILSLVGLLGLSGIVVNGSIILVASINDRVRRGETLNSAIVGGASDRLRAVVLTSLTTIGGLLPLLSETSLQAQFLKPMALTIVSGLVATTVLVLIVVPALVAIQADLEE
jgi:multidrug efflux pump subunit AcrB